MLKIKTANKPSVIKITIEGSGVVRFKAVDANNTVYVARKKDVGSNSNKSTLEFSLPITPDELFVYFAGDAKVTEYTIEPLPAPKLTADAKDFAFFAFIFDFVKKYPTLGRGVYVSGDGYFPLLLTDVLKNKDTGKPKNSPASVSRETGQIGVSKKKFDEFTLPMQVFILFHEWAHYRLDTSSEFECDLQALQWFLGWGFSQVEAMYAMTKVFSSKDPKKPRNPEHDARAEQIYDYITNYNYEKGFYDNGFCGCE